jgi:hypothetical protein
MSNREVFTILAYDIIDFERVVPKELLEFYLDKLNITADRRGIESMYEGLVTKDPGSAHAIYANYQYAGRTAVNIFEEITLPANFLTKQILEQLLRAELTTDHIYGKEFRPPLSERPQIYYVEDRGDSVLIQFVVKGKERRVRDGYEIRSISTVNFETAIIHFGGRPMIELRCSYNQHGKFLAFFEELFKTVELFTSHAFKWTPITKVSNDEAEKIAAILTAGLVEADHKDDGIFDRHIVTAAPNIKDLRKEKEYIENFKNKMLLSQTLMIRYTDKTKLGDYTSDIKFRINMYTGFQFLSKVSEPVIEYVMRVFVDVRYNRYGTVDTNELMIRRKKKIEPQGSTK